MSDAEKKKRRGRALLVAAVGVATVAFGDGCSKRRPVGNLMPTPYDGSTYPVGNLAVANPLATDAGEPFGPPPPPDASAPDASRDRGVKDGGAHPKR
jgi:hypothetical protein